MRQREEVSKHCGQSSDGDTNKETDWWFERRSLITDWGTEALRTHWAEWEGIGEWRAFKLSSTSHSYNSHRRNQLSKTAFLNKVRVLVVTLNIESGLKFAVSEVSWSTPCSSSRCYLGEVFSRHVIRCYLRVLHKGGSRCHSGRYATRLLCHPQERTTQHNRNNKSQNLIEKNVQCVWETERLPRKENRKEWV